MGASYQNNSTFYATMQQMTLLFRDPAFCASLNLRFHRETPSMVGVVYSFGHGMSFTSWGEVMTITLTDLHQGMVMVNIVSECDMPLQVIDWGKNRENVDKILQYIGQNLHRYAQVEENDPNTPKPGTRFCTNCGKPVSETAVFCPTCGTRRS